MLAGRGAAGGLTRAGLDGAAVPAGGLTRAGLDGRGPRRVRRALVRAGCSGRHL